jgi:hypothetical protein
MNAKCDCFRLVQLILLAGCAAKASTVIDTVPAWDGVSSIQAFGSSATPTFGNTVTVPLRDSILQSFSFEINLPSSITFAGYVYAWDSLPPNIDGSGGTTATGARLFQSAPTHTAGTGAFELITFVTYGLPLIPGAQYVLFASTSEFSNSPGSGLWGAQAYFTPDWYSGGAFVFNNNNDSSLWTTSYPTGGWVGSFIPNGGDLAFRAEFSSVPEPGTGLGALGALLCAVLSLRRERVT